MRLLRDLAGSENIGCCHEIDLLHALLNIGVSHPDVGDPEEGSRQGAQEGCALAKGEGKPGQR